METAQNFAFVLVRPRAAGNIGAAARALKNMGFADLRVVSSRPWNPRAANAMAVHARDVLASATVHPDLAAAISDRTLTVGTTGRSGGYRAEARSLRELAPQLVDLSRTNRIAIIFGPEDTGLTDRELKHCQTLLRISTAADYPSLNLAQAVMVIAYELMMAARPHAERPVTEPPLARANAGEVDAMMERMADALVAIGFVADDNPAHIMFTMRAIFGRGGLSPRELDIFNGIAHQLRWYAAGGHATLRRKRAAGIKLR